MRQGGGRKKRWDVNEDNKGWDGMWWEMEEHRKERWEMANGRTWQGRMRCGGDRSEGTWWLTDKHRKNGDMVSDGGAQ